MTAMALTRMVPPDNWFRMAEGIWAYIESLPDPLLGQDMHRVQAHVDAAGRVWLRVHGANAGVRIQSVPPDDHDFADFEGGPL